MFHFYSVASFTGSRACLSVWTMLGGSLRPLAFLLVVDELAFYSPFLSQWTDSLHILNILSHFVFNLTEAVVL